ARGDRRAQRLADEPFNVALHPRPPSAKDSRRGAGPGRGEPAWRSLYAPPHGRSTLPGARPVLGRGALRPSDAPGPRRPARALSRSASRTALPGARPLLARDARCAAAPMPPDPVGQPERSRARPPAQLSRGPVRCSRAARAALLRCPLTRRPARALSRSASRAAGGPGQPAAAPRRRAGAASLPLAGARRRAGFFAGGLSAFAPARPTSSTTESAAASPWRAPSLTTRV